MEGSIMPASTGGGPTTEVGASHAFEQLERRAQGRCDRRHGLQSHRGAGSGRASPPPLHPVVTACRGRFRLKAHLDLDQPVRNRTVIRGNHWQSTMECHDVSRDLGHTPARSSPPDRASAGPCLALPEVAESCRAQESPAVIGQVPKSTGTPRAAVTDSTCAEMAFIKELLT